VYEWNKVDTVTSGPYDDLNPAVTHNSIGWFPTDGKLWVVFERHAAGESQIAASCYRIDLAAWDSAVMVISSGPADEQQIKPDFCDGYYYSAASSMRTMRMAAWQKWKDGRWQVYYSILNDSDKVWTVPVLLVQDTVDNTDVRIRFAPDSMFIVTWSRGDAIMGLMKTSSTASMPESLAVSNIESPSYDVLSFYDRVTILWTIRVDTLEFAVHRDIGTHPPYTRTEPETLWTVGPCYNPHLAVNYYPGPTFSYEVHEGGFSQVYESFPGLPSSNISDDPLAENRNGRGYTSPVITKGASRVGLQWPRSDEFIYEKYRLGDSMLVYLHGGLSDTVRSAGHNRNVCLGSQMIAANNRGYVLAVWESNRSGTSHIYGRLVPIFWDYVLPKPDGPGGYALRQNYPNPFNPCTTIEYSIGSSSYVRLHIYDLLGREVALLVDERKERGSYAVDFDGSRFASGVYFYRLTAGSFVETKKLLLAK
jgi:hypothetical protein